MLSKNVSVNVNFFSVVSAKYSTSKSTDVLPFKSIVNPSPIRKVPRVPFGYAITVISCKAEISSTNVLKLSFIVTRDSPRQSSALIYLKFVKLMLYASVVKVFI